MHQESKIWLDWIEKYYFGALSEEELIQFNSKRKEDSNFDTQVIEHLSFLQTLKNYKKIAEMKAEMNHIHQSMYTRKMVDEAKSFTLKFKQFAQKYQLIISTAACFVVLFFLTLLYINNHNAKSGSYELMMRREVAKIKRSQTNLVHKVNSIEKDYVSPSREKFSGTGFAISTSGYIITNYHVIDGADSLYIQNERGDVYKVKTVTANPEYDLAILKIEDKKFKNFDEIPYIFKRKASMLGEKVYTLGYPKDEPVYGEGYLSANTGFNNDTTSYQLALSINPGNSGGPLFNESGEIIGVISGKQAQMDGFTFAVKSNYLYNTIKELNTDSLIENKVILPKRNLLTKAQRTDQIEKIKNFVFMVKVYN